MKVLSQVKNYDHLQFVELDDEPGLFLHNKQISGVTRVDKLPMDYNLKERTVNFKMPVKDWQMKAFLERIPTVDERTNCIQTLKNYFSMQHIEDDVFEVMCAQLGFAPTGRTSENGFEPGIT